MILDEQQLRIDLAAAFRWSARLNFHEGIANHFSVAVSEDGKNFSSIPKLVIFLLFRQANYCC